MGATAITAQFNNSVYYVGDGLNAWYAIRGVSNTIRRQTSTDNGATWSAATETSVPGIGGSTYSRWGNGVFVVILAESTTAWTSTDAVTWTATANAFGTDPNAVFFSNLVFTNGYFIATTSQFSTFTNNVWFSSNGTTWTRSTRDTNQIDLITGLSYIEIPPPVTSYTLTPAANNVNEGSSLTFTVGGANIVNGTYYWTVSRPEDFAVSSGSFTITSNSGSFSVTPTEDTTTEGAETFTASIRSGSTSGTILATSVTVTINDTSAGPTILASPFVNGGLMTYDFQGANGATTTTQTSGSLSSTIVLTNSTLSTTRAPLSGLTSLFVNGSAGTAAARAEVTGLNIAPTNFTWEGWIYYPSFSTASTAVTVFSVGQNSANLLAVRWLSPTLIEFRTNINGASVGQGGNVFVTVAPSSGLWQHHAITADGTNYRYYLDGTQIGSTTNNAGTWGTGESSGRAINAYTIGNWISAPFAGSWSNAYNWNCRLSSSVVYSTNFTVTKTGMV
jgi:hypothetical protein